ncbi:MAG: hypothetical protein IPK80_28645 [Nannocystis sp.]|nr:hypothetical protein [Nannocystis sp.]
MDDHDVGVANAGEVLGLALDRRERRVIGAYGEELKRDLALEIDLVRPANNAARSRADPGVELVLPVAAPHPLLRQFARDELVAEPIRERLHGV